MKMESRVTAATVTVIAESIRVNGGWNRVTRVNGSKEQGRVNWHPCEGYQCYPSLSGPAGGRVPSRFPAVN
jgi:hypothetical protein